MPQSARPIDTTAALGGVTGADPALPSSFKMDAPAGAHRYAFVDVVRDVACLRNVV